MKGVVQVVARRFGIGQWSFIGPGYEKKWYSTENSPQGAWDNLAEEMLLEFEESGHPTFRAVKGILPTTENWLRKRYGYSMNDNTSTEDKHETNHINNKYNDTRSSRLSSDVCVTCTSWLKVFLRRSICRPSARHLFTLKIEERQTFTLVALDLCIPVATCSLSQANKANV